MRDPSSILAEVAARHRVAAAELTRRRQRRVLLARAEAAYRLRFETDLTLEQIGELIGVTEHSSVAYLAQLHDARRAAGRT